jgi:hypothetical protein
MRYHELLESIKPSLPGATAGISIMSPEEFVQSSSEEVDEAIGLDAPHRELGSDETQAYLKRIVGSPVIDPKTGQPKINKVTGKDKYISGKEKTDMYKLPYIHRNSAVKYYDEAGNRFREEDIVRDLMQRPKALLKQNEKMQHSSGELEQFFNIGLAALTGIAVNESNKRLVIVNTCPGAGSCKVDCFVIHKGGKIQFESPWLNDGRILTFLLNDPEGFKAQLKAEIAKELKAGQKKGYKVTLRWHDSGDFFSPQYLGLAFDVANTFPDVKFYAYTKMAGAALAQKPTNFIINWSEGAHTSQEKQVKAQDPNLERTKNSRIVPTEMFGDFILKSDDGKSFVKGPQGQWQLKPGTLPQLKQRLAQSYGISANSILSYDEWSAKTNDGRKESPVKYNVIIAPGEPDITANSHGVLSTLLLRH